MTRLLFAYSSTSGHTEYVCQVCANHISKKKRSFDCELKLIETVTKKDVDAADIVLLASGTWNTEGIEGQLNPYMHRFVHKDFADYDFKNRPVLIIGCGDARYKYTCRAAQYLEEYVWSHNATHIEPTLRVINEPYGQEQQFIDWCDTILPLLT